jgi:hypothetical protein
LDQYQDARYYAIQAAIDLYGPCSTEMIQTVRAWYAVGVGPDWTGNLTAGFATDDTLGCRLPFPVSFNNSSNLAVSYQWDFGDGNTSTAFSPQHQYNAVGSYTVTLIAEGCNNTFDTLILPNRIVIDSNQVCALDMVANTTDSVTNCEGELYDTGGAGNYLDNSNSTFIIVPGTTGNLVFTFLSFDYAPGDRVTVYDGPNTSSPILGQFSGNTLPGPFTTTNGGITIVESTNTFGNRSGFHASWTCNVVGNEEANAGKLMLIYPNPASDRFRVTYDQGNSGNISLSLVDMFGKVLEKRDFANAGRLSEEFEVKNLASGIYLLRMQTENGQQVQRIRVQ